MRTNNYSRKKKLLALCLSAWMVSSAAAGLAACTNEETSDSSSSSTTETTQKDAGLIKNAGFETFDKNDGLNVIGTSVSGWTRSVNSASSGSALSSKAASGIVDVSDEAWKNLTENKVDDAAKLSEADAKKQWANMSAKDKLEFYADWKDREENEDKKISELDFYQAFNISSSDVPDCANPRTWNYGTDAANADENNNVLMLHNEYSSSSTATPSYQKMGTAQKYTSSSTVTVQAGTSAKFSLWVKTSDLQSTWTDGTAQPAVNKGAYISISNSVGNKDYDPLEIKNINTEILNPDNENNGWMQYEFVLQGSSYASTTFTIVLGLGQGGGTNRSEYVNGYAFFDDIQCEIISNDDFNDAKVGAKEVNLTDENVLTANTTDFKFALTFHKDFNNATILSDKTAWVSANGGVANKVARPTTEKKNDKTYTAANGVSGADVYTGLGFDTTNDIVNIYDDFAAMNGSGNGYLQKIYDNYFKDASLFKDESVLMLLSANGAAYTANAPTNTLFTLPSDENNNSYLAISFFIKTSDMLGVTGAGVTVTDADSKTSLSSLDTTDIVTVDIDDETKDIYDGWQQCFIFLSNETGADITFSLSFTLGPTTVVGTTKDGYESGFAAFTHFRYCEMDEDEFASATSGTYAQVISLKGETEEETGDSGFDSAMAVPSDAIEKGYANPKNYKGVYSGSAYLGNADGPAEINKNETAGLLNKKYVTNEDETENANYATILNALGAQGANNAAKWNDVFGADCTQPLVIYNAEKDGSVPAYGFLGKSTTISSGSYATVSLRVKVSDGAKAYIYLIDTSDDSYKTTLSIERKVSYWYDDNGNICAKDPSDDTFKEKRDVAFKLQKNGLYKVNENWSGAANMTDAQKSAYYANLSAYTEKDADGNLLVAENGVSYDYNNNWRNEGNDGIAFYKSGDNYYADAAHKIPVTDLSSVSDLPVRYVAEAGRSMQFAVGPTNGEWATVTFYIHAGDETKNYRLEVWSGDREGGNTGTNGSYVIFDAYAPTNVTEDTFSKLIKERKEEVTENDYFEDAFSFYDSAKFLRYNADLDENEVGDSYESYVSSAYTSSVAYLKYADGNAYEIYADYSLSEKTVTPDADDADDGDDDADENTESTTNVWLLASSISIAAVLVLAVVSLFVRKIVVNARKKRGYTAVVKSEKKVKKAKKNDKE